MIHLSGKLFITSPIREFISMLCIFIGKWKLYLSAVGCLALKMKWNLFQHVTGLNALWNFPLGPFGHGHSRLSLFDAGHILFRCIQRAVRNNLMKFFVVANFHVRSKFAPGEVCGINCGEFKSKQMEQSCTGFWMKPLGTSDNFSLRQISVLEFHDC